MSSSKSSTTICEMKRPASCRKAEMLKEPTEACQEARRLSETPRDWIEAQLRSTVWSERWRTSTTPSWATRSVLIQQTSSTVVRFAMLDSRATGHQSRQTWRQMDQGRNLTAWPAFVSHPNKELLQIHNPDRFGCSGCHWGNGRATTGEVKGHGRHKYWLWPLFERENIEAGCQQCHAKDRVTQGAETLNLGRDLFYERGCVGCHRYEGFDRETDALSGYAAEHHSTRRSDHGKRKTDSSGHRSCRPGG